LKAALSGKLNASPVFCSGAPCKPLLVRDPVEPRGRTRAGSSSRSTKALIWDAFGPVWTRACGGPGARSSRHFVGFDLYFNLRCFCPDSACFNQNFIKRAAVQATCCFVGYRNTASSPGFPPRHHHLELPVALVFCFRGTATRWLHIHQPPSSRKHPAGDLRYRKMDTMPD